MASFCWDQRYNSTGCLSCFQMPTPLATSALKLWRAPGCISNGNAITPSFHSESTVVASLVPFFLVVRVLQHLPVWIAFFLTACWCSTSAALAAVVGFVFVCLLRSPCFHNIAEPPRYNKQARPHSSLGSNRVTLDSRPQQSAKVNCWASPLTWDVNIYREWDKRSERTSCSHLLQSCNNLSTSFEEF